MADLLIAPLEAGRSDQVPEVWTCREVRILVGVPCWSWEVLLRVPTGRAEPGWALMRPVLRLLAAGLDSRAIARKLCLDHRVVDLVLQDAHDRGWVRRLADGLWQFTALGSSVVYDDAAQGGADVRLLALQDPNSGELFGLCDRDLVFEGSLDGGLIVGEEHRPLVLVGTCSGDAPIAPTPTQIVSVKDRSILSTVAAGVADARVLTTATEPRRERLVVGVIAADEESTVIVPPFDSRSRSAPASPSMQRWLGQISPQVRASLPRIEVDPRIEGCVPDSQRVMLGSEILATSRALDDASRGLDGWAGLVDALRDLMQASFLDSLRRVRCVSGGISLNDRLRASATRLEVTGFIRSTAAAWGAPVDELDGLFVPAALLAGLERRSGLVVAAVLPYAADRELCDFWTACPEAFRIAVGQAHNFDRSAAKPPGNADPLLQAVARFCLDLEGSVTTYLKQRPPASNPRGRRADGETGGTDVEAEPEAVEPPAAEQPGSQLLGATLTVSG